MARESSTNAQPHPKPARRPRRRIRTVDPSALRSVVFDPECASCGRAGSNAHHVIPRGAPHFGDDHPDNFVCLCGTGTVGCHGAFHGSPWTDEVGRRWDRIAVGRAIGESLRPRHARYVLAKLGDEAGADYLLRVYHADVEEVLARV